jgi:hypothetical protein
MQRLVTTILLVIVITPLMGCSDSWQEHYSREYYTISKDAIANCQQYGQTYELHYYNVENKEWKVLCSQVSPYKIITKSVVINDEPEN